MKEEAAIYAVSLDGETYYPKFFKSLEEIALEFPTTDWLEIFKFAHVDLSAKDIEALLLQPYLH